jgi:3-hydroxyisobutyrate dehydrogenase-like beta-hydroxyacid dehydrogenase
MSDEHTPVTIVGVGAMGRALAETLIDAGHRTTIWNRTAGRAEALAGRGATVAGSLEDAVTASPVVVVCLFDHASVHEVLDPIAASVAGRSLVNVTTTTPNEAREVADWARRHGSDYLDGGIMAVPEMIGGPGSAVLYSGSAEVFEQHRDILDRWGGSHFVGHDAGMASLLDLAMLAGMYVMFAGFLHGAAMVGSAGVSATEFATRATPFIAAMTDAFADLARTIDAKDYAGPGQQSLRFSDLGRLVQATVDQEISPIVVQPVHDMIRRQIAGGHGDEGFARIFEELREGTR